MDNKDIEKAIEFIINEQAKFAASHAIVMEKQALFMEQQEALTKQQASLIGQQASLIEHQVKTDKEIATLTEIITKLALQADADRAEMRTIGGVLRELIVEANKDRAQANQDRAEMRDAVSRIEVQADQDRAINRGAISEIKDAIKLLTQAQLQTNQRLERLENSEKH